MKDVGRLTEASHYFKRALEIDPYSSITLFKYGYFMEKQQNTVEAEVKVGFLFPLIDAEHVPNCTGKILSVFLSVSFYCF